MDKTIYYICKYTPLEMLAGFGLRAERLDPAPASFDCAESCTHPNLCGYGKAVLEEVLTRDIRCLLLVDCCDVCRRIYDVLKLRGGMDFLFLLSLPHKNGAAECRLLEQELQRLSDELNARGSLARGSLTPFSALKGARPPFSLYHAEGGQTPEPTPDPHIRLSGAHGGSLLRNMIEEIMPFPVLDVTCTGRRELPLPSDGELPAWSLSDYAYALLNQRRPCMRMQFREEENDPAALGTICHTVKFCDYYSFQYRHMRKTREEHLLKIETDCTPQSSGQLRTRLEAFAEALGVSPNKDMSNRQKKERSDRTGVVPASAKKEGSDPGCTAPSAPGFIAGVDSGSTSTDAVILDRDLHIVGSSILPTGAGAAAGAEKALAAALENAGLTAKDLAAVVTTGYGRSSVGLSDSSVTEITCHAKGAHYLYPAARTVIDIGGQDSKVIRIDENGNVVNFVMNDKCAAGTGRFLEMMARTLELSLGEMSSLGLQWKNDIAISSMCTVFAESEVVSLIADNTRPEDIIHGLNMAVAGKTLSLMKRLGSEPAYIMTGGVGQNRGVVQALEEKLGAGIYVPPEAQLCGALGAALIAAEQLR